MSEQRVVVRRGRRPLVEDLGTGVLTDEHATSSYGQPVLLWHPDPYAHGDVAPDLGKASPFITYGPGDLPPDLWLWREGPVEGPGLVAAWNRLRAQVGDVLVCRADQVE